MCKCIEIAGISLFVALRKELFSLNSVGKFEEIMTSLSFGDEWTEILLLSTR
jgi:hypothetical protein